MLVRPVRPDEALRRAESLAEPGELPALARLGTSWDQIPRTSLGVGNPGTPWIRLVPFLLFFLGWEGAEKMVP